MAAVWPALAAALGRLAIASLIWCTFCLAGPCLFEPGACVLHPGPKLGVVNHSQGRLPNSQGLLAPCQGLFEAICLALALTKSPKRGGEIPLRHRQTKGAETDMPGLPPPRHIPTLPIPANLRPSGVGPLRGMKSGSRCQGRTAVVGSESGPWLLMIG